jgi:hypothetical protein
MKISRLSLSALGVLTFTAIGCMQETKTNAGKAMSFECSGLGHGWDECDSKAGAACGSRGYTVVSRDQGSTAGTSGPSETKRKLNVTCK